MSCLRCWECERERALNSCSVRQTLIAQVKQPFQYRLTTQCSHSGQNNRVSDLSTRFTTAITKQTRLPTCGRTAPPRHPPASQLSTSHIAPTTTSCSASDRADRQIGQTGLQEPNIRSAPSPTGGPQYVLDALLSAAALTSPRPSTHVGGSLVHSSSSTAPAGSSQLAPASPSYAPTRPVKSLAATTDNLTHTVC
jgi:hypothetical protein